MAEDMARQEQEMLERAIKESLMAEKEEQEEQNAKPSRRRRNRGGKAT